MAPGQPVMEKTRDPVSAEEVGPEDQSSRDIPFDKLVLSQTNVRQGKAGVSIEDMADDIVCRKRVGRSTNTAPSLPNNASRSLLTARRR